MTTTARALALAAWLDTAHDDNPPCAWCEDGGCPEHCAWCHRPVPSQHVTDRDVHPGRVARYCGPWCLDAHAEYRVDAAAGAFTL